MNMQISTGLPPILSVFKAHPKAVIPKFHTDYSACFDLCACFDISTMDEDVVLYSSRNTKTSYCISDDLSHNSCLKIEPGYRALISTGLIFNIPQDYSVRLHMRSGISIKLGLGLINSEGIIDSDYTGIVKLSLINFSNDLVYIKSGDRICQGELVNTLKYYIDEQSTQPTPKGNRIGGFGSTGTTN